jgi:hypothetical protein
MGGRFTSLRVFSTVLGSYLAFGIVGLALMVSVGVGPDDEPTTAGRVGHAVLAAVLFPVELIHDRFFMGRPLPVNDWLWIVGVGAIYASVAVLVLALVRRFRRTIGRASSGAQ